MRARTVGRLTIGQKALFCLAVTAFLQQIAAAENKSWPLRFWIDDYAFSQGETTLLREEIEEAGPRALISGESKSAFLAVKGYYAPEQWDVYWTGYAGCMQALPHAVPGHKISCVPGLSELTMKNRLVARLTQFYGEGAFAIIPRSYLLPSQYWHWRMWLAAQEKEDRGEMWVLKEERHRGKGVHVMPLAEAVKEGKQRTLGRNQDLVQAYVGDQLTVGGRKFYIRLWAVVTSSLPLRAYLFDGGVVVFGNSTPDDKKLMTSDDFIVNLWHLGRNTEAAPWSVADFRMYLDNLSGSMSTFDTLWRKMQRSLGLTFAAGVQSMRFSAASFPVAAAGASFELVGIDFLVDKDLRPWLLEVNAVPSLARKVLDCDKQREGCVQDGEAESVFDLEKEKLVHSLFRLLEATAGTNRIAAEAGHPHPPVAKGPDSLADLLARWRSNATDLAALKNKTTASGHGELLSDMGWIPAAASLPKPDAVAEKQSTAEEISPPPGNRNQLAEELTAYLNSGAAEAPLMQPAADSAGDMREAEGPEAQRLADRSGSIELRSVEEDGQVKEKAGAGAAAGGLPTGAPSESRPLEDAAGAVATAGGLLTGTPSESRPPSVLHEVAKAKTVAEVSNLHKYLVKESAEGSEMRAEEAAASQTAEERQKVLEEHLMETSIREIEVALANRFLPLMMIPEAVDFSREHQSQGAVFPTPQTAQRSRHKKLQQVGFLGGAVQLASGLLSPIAGLLERLRVGIVAVAPDVNLDVTLGMSRTIPGMDTAILWCYQMFAWGDRVGTVEAFSVLPKHQLDQRLWEYVMHECSSARR